MKCIFVPPAFLTLVLFPPLQVFDSPVLLEALAEHLPSTFAVGQFHCQPSMTSAGSSKRTGSDSDDHIEGTKVVLTEQKQQESSEISCSSGGESAVAAKIFSEESTKNFTCGKTRKDVLLFCRVNPKEAYVFMGRSLPAPLRLSVPFCTSFLDRDTSTSQVGA